MDDYLEFEKDTKSLKSINLDDLSIVDLNDYKNQLNAEIFRVDEEINKKKLIQKNASEFFDK